MGASRVVTVRNRSQLPLGSRYRVSGITSKAAAEEFARQRGVPKVWWLKAESTVCYPIGKWNCPACGSENVGTHDKCLRCDTRNPLTIPDPVGEPREGVMATLEEVSDEEDGSTGETLEESKGSSDGEGDSPAA